MKNLFEAALSAQYTFVKHGILQMHVNLSDRIALTWLCITVSHGRQIAT